MFNKFKIHFIMKPYIYILFAALLFTHCSKNDDTSGDSENNLTETRVVLTEAQVKNANLDFGVLEKRPIAYIFKVNGKIDVPPQNNVSISAQLGGYLKSSQLLPGMKIKKGEVMAIMEDQQYIQIQQDYLTTKTKLIFLEKEYARQKELNENKATSDKVFQQTEADYVSQKIILKSLYEKLKLVGINPESLSENTISRNINMYSPIDGYVSKVNVNVGKYVNPSDVLFELVNPSDIHLALTVFEKDINKLFIGQKVMAYTNNNPEEKHHCEIILIGQHLSADRSVEVHCHFDDYDKTLLPGMYMNAEIEVNLNQAFALPTEAIVNFEGKNYCFSKEKNNAFQLHEIEIGNSENNYTEVLNSNTIDGKSIVIKGAYTLLMALKNTSED